MARRVFYSFHYQNDNWRVAQIRNIGSIDGNKPANDNDWEEIKRGGDKAIKNWIDSQMFNCLCTIVLIGSQTANRKWINYEIEKTLEKGKGLFGIYIHNLKDKNGLQSLMGTNPFEYIKDKNGNKLSNTIPAYNPPYFDSKDVYSYIANNIESWIEKALIR